MLKLSFIFLNCWGLTSATLSARRFRPIELFIEGDVTIGIKELLVGEIMWLMGDFRGDLLKLLILSENNLVGDLKLYVFSKF